jgi:hypothetical protein
MSLLKRVCAAFIHAVFPSLCTATGSRIIKRLYDRMIINRTRLKEVVQSSPALRELFRRAHLNPGQEIGTVREKIE